MNLRFKKITLSIILCSTLLLVSCKKAPDTSFSVLEINTTSSETASTQQTASANKSTTKAIKKPNDQTTSKSIDKNGTYSGIVSNGASIKLYIKNYSDNGFDFIFHDDFVAGHAKKEQDGSFQFYDENGQGINFRINNQNEIVVEAGYKHGSLAATYKK